MSGLLLFAEGPQAKAVDKTLSSVEFWIAIGLLTAILIGGAILLFFLDRWKRRQLQANEDSAGSLTSFRAMYERGELSEEEYQKILARVAAKVKKDVAASNPSMAAAPKPAPNPPSAASEPSGGNSAAQDRPPDATSPESS